MLTPRSCRQCGQTFSPAKSFHHSCWNCWRAEHGDQNSDGPAETLRLRQENEALRLRLAQPRLPALDPAAIRWLITLVHPDRHQNSRRANEVTATLLQMREEQSQ